ncbi:MAG: reprolysin-like metallopeptidase [Dongiaceae bacterium]
MPRETGGSGRVLSAPKTASLRASFGPQLPALLDLNRAKPAEIARHPLFGRKLAAKLVRLRKQGRIASPEDLFHGKLITREQLSRLQSYTFGKLQLRPLLQAIEIDGPRLYVDERFALHFSWLKSAAIRPEILSVAVRFPSGRRSEIHVRLSNRDLKRGELSLPGFLSGESGEFYVMATLRDGEGGVSRQSAIFGVFTRNPVQIFVTPQFMTQSGSAGAPKYNFSENRWYCYADVRWVNGESSRVNLGRRVDVAVTDAGIGSVANFSFTLSGDIVIPAFSTVYGNWYTWHGSGGIFDEFSAKGDLTFRYSMSGSGFSPARSQVWRTMRTIGYNLIRVGDFTGSERSEYRRAAGEIASGIFQSRDMTVYGTELYRIEGTPDMEADKTRFRFIDNNGEFDAMAEKYSVPNWYMDVFMVEGYFGGFGASYVNAPTDKNGTHSGIVIGKDSDTVNLGQTFAHEAGHHIGLEHADESDGCADTDPASPSISDNFIFSASRRDSATITGCQINKMRQHGFVRSMTP